MTHSTPKTRTVFCRICDTDYARLTEICEAKGQSMSGLLRTALHRILSESQPSDPLLSKILNLISMLEEVSKQIEHLHPVPASNSKPLGSEATGA